MTNTKIYKIKKITSFSVGGGYGDKDKIELDGYIEYRDGRENWVIIGNLSSWTNYYFIGAEVIIDLDIAKERSSGSWVYGVSTGLISTCKLEKERKEEDKKKEREEERALERQKVEELESLRLEVSYLSSQNKEILEKGFKLVEKKDIEIDELKKNLEQIKEAFNSKIEEGEQLNQEFNALKLENKETKKALGNSREEVINYVLKEEEIELESLIKNLVVNRARVRDLKRFYQQLIQARENYKQEDINTAKKSIEEIKDEFLDQEISIQNVQLLCRKCEKIVKLEIEQENLYKERFEARQEVVLYNASGDSRYR